MLKRFPPIPVCLILLATLLSACQSTTLTVRSGSPDGKL